jgi:transposase-like protein
MTDTTKPSEILAVQRLRRWTASEKVRMVEETFEPGTTASLAARRLRWPRTWRRPVAQGSLTAAGSGESARRPWRRRPQGGAEARHGVKKQLPLRPLPPKGALEDGMNTPIAVGRQIGNHGLDLGRSAFGRGWPTYPPGAGAGLSPRNLKRAAAGDEGLLLDPMPVGRSGTNRRLKRDGDP